MMESSAMPINWYPGHMAKTKRMLSEQIRRIDLIIEICDARLPYSSRNPEINDLAAGKKRIVFLNKADLADPEITSLWTKKFRKEGTETFSINAKKLISPPLQISTAVEDALAAQISDLTAGLYEAIEDLRESIQIAGRESGVQATAEAYRGQVIPAMERLRSTADALEVLIPQDQWPFPAYSEILYNI